MLVLVAVSTSKKRDTWPKLASFIYASSLLVLVMEIPMVLPEYPLCLAHTHTCTQAEGWELFYGLIKTDSCRLLQLYPRTKIIITVVHLHNSYDHIDVNYGHPWSSYSINLTKTSVEPFCRIFAPHGGSRRVWGLEQVTWKNMTPLEESPCACEPKSKVQLQSSPRQFN